MTKTTEDLLISDMEAINLPEGYVVVRKICPDREDLLLVKRTGEFELMVLKKLTKLEDECQNVQVKDISQLFSNKPSSFVILLLDVFTLQNDVFIVMEFLEGPSLRKLIVDKGPFLERTAVFYSACILIALKYIHSLNIVHRDVVSGNVGTDREGYAKLMDFESSKIHENIYPHFFIDYIGLGDITKDMLIGEDIHYKHLSSFREKLSSVSYYFLRLLNVVEMCYVSWNWKSCPVDFTNHAYFRIIDWEDLENRRMEPPRFYSRRATRRTTRRTTTSED